MNRYRIRYKKGETGLKYVQADSVNGFKPSCDSYVFKMEGEVVAVMPKTVVISVEKISGDEAIDE